MGTAIWNALSSPSVLARSGVLRPCALIVEPDPANHSLYASVLAQLGVDCVCVSSAQDAIPSLSRSPCIGIFLDSGARQKGGLEVANRIRDIAGLEHTPVILVSTAPADEINDPQVHGTGLVDFLPFPLDQGLLQRKVALLLELRRPRDIDHRYRAIFEHPTILTSVLQAVRTDENLIADWIHVDANNNALSVLKQTRAAVLGKRLSEVYPDRAERLIAMCTQVLMTGEPAHYEAQFDTQEFLTCVFPAGPNAVVSTAIDITARNRAEREVQRLLDANRAEKEWLFAVLNGINEEVYFTDSQGRYTYANPAALREFGHQSLAGVPVDTVVSGLRVLRPDGTPRPLSEAPPLRALTGEVIKNEEQLVYTPRTGELRHREVSSAPVRDAEGQIFGSVSVARDVTETKRAEETLRAAVAQARAAEAESRATLAAELVAMQRLHDISTTAMTTSDQQVLLEAILDATIALHGAASGSIQLLAADSQTLHIAAQRGMDAEALERFAQVDADTNSACGRALARRERVIIEDVATDTTGTFDPETALRMGLGAVHSMPLFRTDGAVLGILSTHFRSPRKFTADELRITDLYGHQASIAIERKRAEDALIAAREAADRANKAKSHFVRAASHDLRQSVQTLTLLNGTLRNSSMDKSGRAALRQQGEAIDTMMHLLDALLNISKLESGTVAPDVTDFTVTSLFEKLRREFSSHAANKGLELKIEAPLPLAIHSDPILVGEVLRNFLSNAIKFTPQGSITLRASRVGSRVRLTVVDTGIGIPREELPLIFGEFYQVGVSATLSRQGHGLGLGIVQRIATLLTAEVQVDSELGKGSAFSLTVAAGDHDPATLAARAPERPASRNASPSTLLLVEDDVSVRTSMQRFLSSLGHTVVSAASLDQALALVNTGPRLDLLLTDFHLPGDKTGYDVIRQVRETLGESLPAIMLSGDTSEEIEEMSHEVDVCFVSKPIDPRRLVELVQELGARSAVQESAT